MLLVIVIVVISIIVKIYIYNRWGYSRWGYYQGDRNVEKFAVTTAPITIQSSVLSDISNSLKSDYNKLNTNRFGAIDNQIRIDNLNTRVDKLLGNIQQVFNMDNKSSNTNQMTFY